jgi:SAM-dependent methyltransferase
MWSSGDWPAVATHIQAVSDALVERLGVGEGEAMLDVGTGSGNAALAGAQRGAEVTGVDITTELFDAARARAEEAGVTIELLEGAAAELPCEDDSFDKVTSVFGCMFDPQHERAAAELVRVTRPGGSFGVCAWTPQSLNGQMLATTASMLPPPPEGFQPPILWGSEDYVSGLFDGEGVELELELETAEWEWESPQAWVDFCAESLGPMIAARAVAEPQGEWEELRRRFIELFSPYADEQGRLQGRSEYLRTVGRAA